MGKKQAKKKIPITVFSVKGTHQKEEVTFVLSCKVQKTHLCRYCPQEQGQGGQKKMTPDVS